ncbi:hypothetical protein Pme01_52810 [Planosporangium mesophilum]|uniref:Uncharacterized protein n=1 Tax=Planosporangium mesophilum TaxID=689768 RepID=A0A8J3X3N9_9ACTN|nr:hypothetical protein Pme01_52810 [Planosporangium mesophilum]
MVAQPYQLSGQVTDVDALAAAVGLAPVGQQGHAQWGLGHLLTLAASDVGTHAVALTGAPPTVR